MFVSKQDQSFGPMGDPKPDVPVPWTLLSRELVMIHRPDFSYKEIPDDEKCILKILTTNRHGGSDVTSWYKIWEAANAVYYKCISAGYRGSLRGLGEQSEKSCDAQSY